MLRPVGAVVRRQQLLHVHGFLLGQLHSVFAHLTIPSRARHPLLNLHCRVGVFAQLLVLAVARQQWITLGLLGAKVRLVMALPHITELCLAHVLTAG